MSQVLILLASKGDLEHGQKMAKFLTKMGVDHSLRIGSAHKVPLKVMEIIREYESENVVFITVAGRSNALSGFVDANTVKPVIACPPYSEKFGGADLFSSLRMPSGVCPMLVLEPEEAALAAMKILGVGDRKILEKVHQYQQEKKKVLEQDDLGISKNG